MVMNKKILEFIRLKKDGASVSDISDGTGHTRATAAKYLELMKMENIVDYREVGKAKVWFFTGENKKKILIVDDEPNIVKLIKIILNPRNYDLLEATNGLEALERVREHMPDLIILDLMMPKMDGYAACGKIKENALTKAIPIIMLTAKRELDDKKKGIHLGADDYLTKPFNPNELRARVNALLNDTNGERDSVTNLPLLTSSENVFSARKKENFSALCFVLQNAEKYRAKYGLAKTEEMLKILAQLINHHAENASSSMYLCYFKGNFIVFIEQDKALQLKKAVESAFTATLPFFYDRKGAAGNNHLAFAFNKYSLAKMKTFTDLKKMF